VASLKARPTRQTELDFLLENTAVLIDWSPLQRERVNRSRRLIRRTPALRNRERGLLAEIEELIVKGLTPSHASKAEALRIRLLVATYLAAIYTVMNAYLQDGGEPAAYIEAVERLLREGFGKA